MAFLETVDITPVALEHAKPKKGSVSWVPSETGKVIEGLPQIFFSNGEPWRVANAYANDRIESPVTIKTVASNMRHLKAYATWLEENDIDWRHFPRRKGERCLFRYRGQLVQMRDAGALSGSTVNARMQAIIHFYRWAQAHGWVEEKELWEDKKVTVRFVNSVGLSGTLSLLSSELKIPHKKSPGNTLEQGLVPISASNRNLLLKFLKSEGNAELHLMVLVAAFTGARSETIRTIRIVNLENAVEDPLVPSIMRVPVGPGTGVSTKYGVSGDLLFPKSLIDETLKYAYSLHRTLRQSKAKPEKKGLLFLTIRGNAYEENTFTRLMSGLRSKLVKAGHGQFSEFKFHQLRATYGTELMRWALEAFPQQADAIAFVRNAMFHKQESTTWKYIRFIDEEPIKERISSEFFKLFTGQENANELIEEMAFGN